MQRRADKVEDAFTIVAESILNLCNILIYYEIKRNDERIVSHDWVVNFFIEGGVEPPIQILLTQLNNHRESLSTPSWNIVDIIAGEVTMQNEVPTVCLTFRYERVPPPAAVATAAVEHENTRKTLFRKLFERYIQTELAKGETCGICLGDRCQGLSLTEYYLCANLHLSCRPCINDWRRVEDRTHGRGKNKCPFCRDSLRVRYHSTLENC